MALWYQVRMARLKSILAVLLLVLGPVPAAWAQATSCPPPTRPMLRAEFYFGRNIGGRVGVSERQWARFLAREITPRFPDGLTVLDARGQWRDPARQVLVREPSKLVVIVAADDADTRRRLAEVAAAYKKRFRQKSAGLVLSTVCAAF